MGCTRYVCLNCYQDEGGFASNFEGEYPYDQDDWLCEDCFLIYLKLSKNDSSFEKLNAFWNERTKNIWKS